jgi:hypothetical protein
VCTSTLRVVIHYLIISRFFFSFQTWIFFIFTRQYRQKKPSFYESHIYLFRSHNAHRVIRQNTLIVVVILPIYTIREIHAHTHGTKYKRRKKHYYERSACVGGCVCVCYFAVCFSQNVILKF